MGETTSHAVFGDKVRVYHRANSTLWQCATYFEGKEWRVGTKTDVFALAKEFAEGWHLELRGKSRDQLKPNAPLPTQPNSVPLTKDKHNPRYSKS
ncbi:hypothetical protein [Agrobacterium tumefaciens]|uniref:hypothetical protein n=1 Tax=Agrobacterium tumefaciens TaxID=358 RepID=UPI0015747CA5|nr:hypothetical protein [Agrobacterium tumefaciens]